ncbi:MAG TPA: hypothetical protein VL171_17360 [Verrucomicrobiae bacterium]|nr:hypothetical protein [Verrucomicrobiae bacterium]
MNPSTPSEFYDWFDLTDLSAIADPDDKVAECEYFLMLASTERDAQRFRWLMSAFFNAAYSFFEISAFNAYHAFQDSKSGEWLVDREALDTLRRYVEVDRDRRNPSRVKTKALHKITKRLYELRKGNTHHYPLSIMATGPSLPEDFQFGCVSGKEPPALAFCRDAISLIHQVQTELER